jgi:hypothetical protein
MTNKTEVTKEVVGNFVNGIAEIAAMPESGFVIGWDNGLYVKFTGETSAVVTCLQRATVFSDRASAVKESSRAIRNGNGEYATVREVSISKVKEIESLKKYIMMIIEKNI